MYKLDVYNNCITNDNGELENYFFFFFWSNDDGSKNCCGYLQDQTDIITLCSDFSPDGKQSLKIMNYGTMLSLKMIYKYGSGNEFLDYMVNMIKDCSYLDANSIETKLTNVGNVKPEWKVEKFADPTEVFSRLEKGESIGKIVGATALNYHKDSNAVEQEPNFDLDIQKDNQVTNNDGRSI